MRRIAAFFDRNGEPPMSADRSDCGAPQNAAAQDGWPNAGAAMIVALSNNEVFVRA
jgi:hypothetical protein